MNNPPSDANDPNAQPQQAPQGQPTDGKNPLDALEELLNQAKQGAGAGPTVSMPGQAAQEAETDNQQELEEQAAQARAAAEYQRLSAESQKADSDQLEKQRQALEEIKSMPEYQARVAQMEEKEVEQAKEQDKQDGFGIKQIEHKKI